MTDEIKDIAIEDENVEISDEELIEMLGKAQGSKLEFYREAMEFEDDELNNLVDSDDFQNGVKVGSYFGGMYTTLVNMGIDLQTASDLLINQQTLMANERSQKVNADMSIEMSKNQIIQMEKSQL